MNTGIKSFDKKILSKIQKQGLLDEVRIGSKLSDCFPDCPPAQEYFRTPFPNSLNSPDDVAAGMSGVIDNFRINPKTYQPEALNFIGIAQNKKI